MGSLYLQHRYLLLLLGPSSCIKLIISIYSSNILFQFSSLKTSAAMYFHLVEKNYIFSLWHSWGDSYMEF